MSFSGLKTALITLLKREKLIKIEDLCASFLSAVIDTVLNKVKSAIEKTKVERLVIAGGVAASSMLREKFSELSKKMGFQLFIPSPRFCTDNGAMVAYTALKYLERGYCDSIEIDVYPKWKGVKIGEKIRTTFFKG